MNKTNASKWMRNYMNWFGPDLQEISEDLNIPTERLKNDCEEPFWADEFLALCAYFDVDVDRIIERNLMYYSEDDEFYEFEGHPRKDDEDED